MNYIELDLGGKKRGAKLGIGYLKNVTETKKMTLDEVFKSVDGSGAILVIPELIYLSLSYNAKRKKEVFDYTEEDVFDWIDEAGGVTSSVYQEFTTAFTESLGADVGKTQPQKKEAKK